MEFHYVYILESEAQRPTPKAATQTTSGTNGIPNELCTPTTPTTGSYTLTKFFEHRQTSASLTSPAWSILIPVTMNASGTAVFEDTDAALTFPAFYRAVGN